jgi:uncharacterized protein (TIGR03118 family)
MRASLFCGAQSLLAGFALVSLTLIAPLPAYAIYVQENLVSDVPGLATFTDSDLVNPWGMAHSATSPWWISNAGTGVSTLYDAQGVKNPNRIVTIPPPPGGAPPSAPTGQVFNASPGFVLNNGTKASFLFATEGGTLAGWNNGLGNNAVTVVDNSGADASYKGLAIGNNGTADFLYAADFHNAKVDVFDTNFAPATLGGSFTDPNLPAGYAPFGIQNILGNIYVTYALQDAAAADEVAGPGLGYVDEFDANGNLVRRFASAGSLNAPWGIALAPMDFGPFSGDLLVGNFGDGRINAFDPTTTAFLGQLHDMNGPLEIEGLWGIAFGNDGTAGLANVLYFTAGIDDEEHGLFGKVESVPEPSTLAILAVGLLGALRIRRRKART